MAQLDITFFGRHCRFSATVLAALIEHGHRPRLIVVPGARGFGARILQEPSAQPRLPLTPTFGGVAVLPTVASLAWSSGAKLVEVSRDLQESIPHRYHELARGIVVSACYPWTLSDAILERPPMGAVNVHPSLLPAHRGPDPLFWTLHAGDRQAGVTIHSMTSQLDGGPIRAQETMNVPLRSRYDDLEQQAVDLGARLLCETLDRISTGEANAAEQSGHDIGFEPYPRANDLLLDTNWTAERAFRFVYGVGPTHGPIAVSLPDGETVLVADALSLPTANTPNQTRSKSPDSVSVEFIDGVVLFRQAG